MFDPFERVFHRCDAERRAADSTFLLDGCEFCPLKDTDVFRNGGERHVEAFREFADRAVTSRETCEDVAARGIGEGEECRIERF